jgi:hypothetical protein
MMTETTTPTKADSPIALSMSSFMPYRHCGGFIAFTTPTSNST